MRSWFSQARDIQDHVEKDPGNKTFPTDWGFGQLRPPSQRIFLWQVCSRDSCVTCHTGPSICFTPLDQYFSEKFSSIQRKRALKYHFLDDLPRKEKVYCENCTTDWMDLTNRIKEMFRQPFQENLSTCPSFHISCHTPKCYDYFPKFKAKLYRKLPRIFIVKTYHFYDTVIKMFMQTSGSFRPNLELLPHWETPLPNRCVWTSLWRGTGILGTGFKPGETTKEHTSYLSRMPRIYSCKNFLAGVNFYRFNAKNWQFTVYFAVITQKLAIYCVFCHNLRGFSV